MVALVTVILGFLVVLQLRAQGSAPALANLTAQDLTVLIANLNTRNDQLRLEVSSLEAELRRLDAAQDRGGTSIGQIRADLQRVQAWSGVAPVVGSGVRVGVSGPIGGETVQDVLNELWNAGAEAIAVAGVRIVPGTVVAGPPRGLSLEDTPIFDPFEIEAIGSPEALAGSLTRIGGIVAQIAATQPDVAIDVLPRDDLQLAATERSLSPRNGQPRL